MSEFNLVVCDGNNMLAAQTHTHLTLTVPETNTPSGGVYGLIIKLRSIALRELDHVDKVHRLAVAFDRGRPAFRTELLPTYKSARDAARKEKEKAKDPYLEAYSSAKKNIGPFLRALGIDALYAPEFEADDVVGAVALHRTYAGLPVATEIVAVSGDDDYIQLASKEHGISVYQPTPRQLYRECAVWYQLARALAGDKSDEIPGIPGIGEAKSQAIASWLLEQPGRITKFPHQYDGPHVNVVAKCPESGHLVRRNMRIMGMGYTAKDAYRSLEVRKGLFDKKVFIGLCEEWGFESILGEIDQFVRVFEDMSKVVR